MVFNNTQNWLKSVCFHSLQKEDSPEHIFGQNTKLTAKCLIIYCAKRSGLGTFFYYRMKNRPDSVCFFFLQKKPGSGLFFQQNKNGPKRFCFHSLQEEDRQAHFFQKKQKTDRKVSDFIACKYMCSVNVFQKSDLPITITIHAIPVGDTTFCCFAKGYSVLKRSTQCFSRMSPFPKTLANRMFLQQNTKLTRKSLNSFLAKRFVLSTIFKKVDLDTAFTIAVIFACFLSMLSNIAPGCFVLKCSTMRFRAFHFFRKRCPIVWFYKKTQNWP